MDAFHITAEFLLQVLLIVASGGGTYAAIRADLAQMKERCTIAFEGQKDAHERITAHIENHHTTKGK